MNTKMILRLLLSLCLMVTAAQAQNCGVLLETINENFNAIPHNSLPACWTRHTPTVPGNVFNGVAINSLSYQFHWQDTQAPADQLAPKHFVLVMQRSTMKGPVTFKASRQLSSVWQWPVEVGTMSDPNNPSTFEPLYAFYPTSTIPTTYTANLTNYTGTNQFIAFRTFMSEGHTFTIDDITWSGPPAVLSPALTPKGF
jgi:hypothetical protein